jgi:trans-2-enoyl-CoA reductase
LIFYVLIDIINAYLKLKIRPQTVNKNSVERENTLYETALSNWSDNSKITHITSMNITMLSYFRSKGLNRVFSNELKKHFKSNTIKKNCFEFIKAIEDYELGLVYLREMKESTQMVKKFQSAVKPFLGSSNSRNIDINTDDLRLMKLFSHSVICGLY